MRQPAAAPCQSRGCGCLPAPAAAGGRSRRSPAGGRLAAAAPLSASAGAPGGAESEQHFDPYYTKFWTLSDTINANIREWRDLSADGVELPPATPWSKLVCALLWAKYTLVPEPLRYAWFCVWSAARRFWHPFHRKLVLQGAKLDVALAARAHPGKRVTVDRARALRRYHWRANPAREAWHRLGLLAVHPPPFLAQKPSHRPTQGNSRSREAGVRLQGALTAGVRGRGRSAAAA